jgi:8-amino-7-oxononanoate synthase
MPLLHSAPGPTAVVDGRSVLYFVGTAYHCLQNHPAVVSAAQEALGRLGMGSATSRGRFGTTNALLALEMVAARFFGTQTSLHLPSGYLAPAVVMNVIGGQFDCICHDENTHHALLDAAAATRLHIQSFPHRSAAALEGLLQSGRRTLVLTDGVFAMRGSVAPLDQYAQLLPEHPGSALLVDDSHGMGVLGESGRGTLEHFGLWGPRANAGIASALLVCGTLSKALGGYGGIIPGSRDLIEQLQQRSPIFNGASPAPAPVLAGSAAALQILSGSRQLLKQLSDNAALLRAKLKEKGIDAGDWLTPIIWLELGDAPNMQSIQRRLMERGIAIDYVPRYAGAGPQGGLRIAVSSAHTAEMIGQLTEELGTAL